ncbi:DUF1831 domain-containing protein [Companilactobacillus alimentarius]|uniref:hypothetical protein n=1 Tax=Companilactobacillus alimentarius TaxID=1602 RepID=UPI0006F027F2|nr:hypothetical protein [Companilactobacillus alimentarius]KRK75108.1 hypothetical protein FC67_GL001619 [Companilactobacillus alimentarius DSM 20249]MDT6951756.1 hypothetical protein [Companilactobacillus alimentarius]GEO44118.1 cysteine desulfurase [Companilactobacillus alimentarius]
MDKRQAQVLGDQEIYELNPDVKRYSLMDSGFMETNKGGFRLEHPLNGTSPYAARFYLKAVVNKDLDNLKLSITDKSGMHNINIFKLKDSEAEIDDYRYLMKFLKEKNVLTNK